MASSGTYDFAPSIGELVLYSFNLIQIRSSALQREHLESARMAANLMFADWANDGINLWKVEPYVITLVNNQSVYTLPASAVAVLDVYASLDDMDRILTPVSRTEYASFPNKLQTGYPTVFWYDKLIAPTITFWQVPITGGPTTITVYIVRQIQDANLAGGETPEIPYRWLKAMADGLAVELGRLWNPASLANNIKFLEASYLKAKGNDVEVVPLVISPMLGGYFR